jgi:ribulose-phosphate 3-epimerase
MVKKFFLTFLFYYFYIDKLKITDMHHKVAPSLLSADFLNLRRDVEMINNSEADWFHCDVMDGSFVPNISFGFPIIKQIGKIAKKPLDVHLMIVNPDKYIAQVKDAGAYMMNVHYEACTHLHRTVATIREAGMKAAVTLNPHTPVSLLEDILQDLDMVLLMSVNPGFGGQKFIDHSLTKVSKLKEMILKQNLHTLIEVDGGVNLETGKRLVEAGADVLVAGNAIFADPNPEEMIHKLKSLA